MIDKIFKKYPTMRIGGGPEDSEIGLTSLKSHPFLKGVNFTKLKYLSPPLEVPRKMSKEIDDQSDSEKEE